jgi:dipeptidase E
MRLYLSSLRVGDAPERLLALVGDNRRTAVVCNAADGYPEVERARAVEHELAELEEIGLDPHELDLRDHFASREGTESLPRRLRPFGLIWVRGGNTFVLQRAVLASGFDGAVTELLNRDAVAYGGYSAGVCILTPSLEGIDLCDDLHEVPPGYEDTPMSMTGLGLLPYAVVPHHRTPEHPGTRIMDRVAEHYLDIRVPFVTLRDSDVIIREGADIEVVQGKGATT